ncbi:spermatogenesis-associated protein 31D1-like [Talpa occidentalis]|uniref:spermatogenesis-associated protein 31D1-like n=1 Tax=Talpa occidentalis TaxID=50954 RepID=UPI00188F296C|nr:spermatogenesis-associated protein 31D1-like [Talpa occidentalis]
MAESSFTMSSAFPAAPAGDQIPVSLLQPSPPPLSTPLHSPNPLTCSDEFLAPSLGYNLSPEPFPSLGPEYPAGHSSPQHRAFSPVPQYHNQRVDSVLPAHTPLSLNNIFSGDPTLCQGIKALPNLPQPMNPDDPCGYHHPPPTLSVSSPQDTTVTRTQSKAISISFKTVSENTTSCSPPGLSVSDWLASTWAPRGDFTHEWLALPSFETSVNLPFLSADVLELLERQVQKRSDFLMWKDKEKNSYSFPKPQGPGYQPNSSGGMLGSPADKDDSAVSLPQGSPKGKPQELQMHELPPHLKSLGDYLQQKRIQFFWGLPSLHSESLRSAISLSGGAPPVSFFNRISNASTNQEAPELPQPLPLSSPEIQTPTLPQTPPQSPSMPQSQPPADLPCPIPAQPSGPSHQIKICGVFSNRPENDPDCLQPADTEFLEWHVLQKQLADVWGLPAVVQSSYKDFSASPPDFPQRRHSLVSKSISILPGDFPISDKLRRKLEHHLRKRLIQHCCGLPQRIVHSMSLQMPPEWLSEANELGGYSAPSGSTVLQGRSCKTLNVGLSQSGSVHERKSSVMSQCKKDAGRSEGHSPEKVSAKLHNQVGQDDLCSSVCQDYSLNTSQQLSFMKSSAQNLLEDHMKRFRLGMRLGPPSRVRQSLDIFKETETSSLPNHPSSTNMTTQEDSKSGGFTSIRRKSNGEEKVGLTGVGPVRAHPVPATSHLGRDREGSVREPIPAVTQEPAEGAQRMKGGRPSLLPVKHSLPGKSRQTQCPQGTRCPPMPPARQAVATHEPEADRMSFSSRAEMLQGKERRQNLEMLSKAGMSREIFRAEELDAPRSKSSDILITSKPGSPPPAPLSSDNLTVKSSLTHAQGISSGDMEASQVLQAHLVDSGFSPGRRLGNGICQHAFKRWQDKNFPPAAKRVSLRGTNTDELGGGDARLGTPQPRRHSVPTRNMALHEAHWRQTAQVFSKEGQPPAENIFRQKVKHFLQWIRPRKREENSQEKGSSISSCPLKSGASFSGMSGAQNIKTGTRKSQERLGYHETIHSPVMCGRTHQNAKVQTCTEPIQRHPLNYRGPCCKVTHAKFCPQAAVIAGQTHPTNIRWVRDMGGHPQKAVALGEQLLCGKRPPPPHGICIPSKSQLQASRAPRFSNVSHHCGRDGDQRAVSTT